RDVRGNEYRTSMNALEIDVQSDAQNETGKVDTQTEKADVERDGTDVKRDDADVKTEENSEKYLSALLITIVLLLSAAFSRYP
ncbi:MAG: hypothetical protein PHS80_00475, partial [Methanothrix sp.]|nr:hypothetical protein [Methanothrix sp.]